MNGVTDSPLFWPGFALVTVLICCVGAGRMVARRNRWPDAHGVAFGVSMFVGVLAASVTLLFGFRIVHGPWVLALVFLAPLLAFCGAGTLMWSGLLFLSPKERHR